MFCDGVICDGVFFLCVVWFFLLRYCVLFLLEKVKVLVCDGVFIHIIYKYSITVLRNRIYIYWVNIA